MRLVPSGRVIAAVGVMGSVAVLWLLPIGSSSRADPPTSTAEPPAARLLDLRDEVDLLDAAVAVMDAHGTVEGHFVLPWSDGGMSPDSYFSKRDEVGYQPPVVFRVKYAGEGSGFTAVSFRGDLEVGRPATSGFTIVATLSEKTFANTASAFCELEVLEAPFTILDAGWLSEGTLFYQPEGATARLSCANMSELRTGELLSLDVVFRLPPNPILIP